MQFSDLLRRSWKNVTKSKVRFVLTALSLAVGAFTISLTLAISSAARGQFDQSIASKIQKDGIMVLRRDTSDKSQDLQTSEQAAQETQDEIRPLAQEDVDTIKGIEGVKEVQAIRDAIVRNVIINGQTYDLPGSGEPFTFNANPTLVAGSAEDMGQDGVLVPESFVKAAGASQAQELVGKKVVLAWTEFGRQGEVQRTADATVKGVVKAGVDKVFDDVYLALPLNESIAKRQYDAQPTLFGRAKDPPTYKYIGVIATSEAAVAATSQRIQAAGYSVYSIAEANQQLVQTIDAIQFFFLGIAGIAILAAIFGVVNTQYMAVYERTREIGVMKALGLPRRGVLMLFALEATWIGIAGSVIGLALSLPVMALLNTAIKQSIAADLPGPLAVMTLPNVVIVIAALAAIALLAGLLPARKASRLNPVDALRIE